MAGLLSSLDASLSTKSKANAMHEFTLALRLWNICLLSFALDPILLALLERYEIPLPQLELTPYVITAILIALIFSDKMLTLKIYKGLGFFRKKAGVDKGHKHLSLLSWGVHIIPTFLVVAILVESGKYLFAAVLTVLVVVSFVRHRREGTKYLADRLQVKANRKVWLDVENQQILMICLLPILLVRAASFFSMISVAADGAEVNQYVLIFSCCLLLEFALMPWQEQFVTRCPLCARWTSIAFQGDGICPTCHEEKIARASTAVSINGGTRQKIPSSAARPVAVRARLAR